MLLTFLARDCKTEHVHKFPIEHRDTSYYGWETDAWNQCVQIYCLPESIQPIEWYEEDTNENDHDRFRDPIQLEIKFEETDHN